MNLTKIRRIYPAELRAVANKTFHIRASWNVKHIVIIVNFIIIIIIIIIIYFPHGLGRLTCSGIDALPSIPGASQGRI